MMKDPAPREGDVRSQPAYRLPEAAHYLRLPTSTLRAWLLGQDYGDPGARRRFLPAISIADGEGARLSFLNFVEAHVLSALRRKHNVSLQQIRKATTYLRKEMGSEHPLAMHQFETDGLSIFIDHLDQLINVTKEGQLAMRELFSAYLQRVEWDKDGVAARLYLFTRKFREGITEREPRAVVIDPRVSFGLPVLAGTGLRTAVIAERYKAGETMEELATDYARPLSEIEEAIRCELELKAA